MRVMNLRRSFAIIVGVFRRKETPGMQSVVATNGGLWGTLRIKATGADNRRAGWGMKVGLEIRGRRYLRRCGRRQGACLGLRGECLMGFGAPDKRFIGVFRAIGLIIWC